MPALAFAAGEQPIAWTSQFDLIAKSFRCEFRQREFRPATGRLGIRNPKHHVAKIDLIFPRTQQFFADAKPRFCDDADDVAKVARRMLLDQLLLRPRHIMRTKQTINFNRKFDSITWVAAKSLLFDGYIQEASQNPELLMDCGRLQFVLLHNP